MGLKSIQFWLTSLLRVDMKSRFLIKPLVFLLLFSNLLVAQDQQVISAKEVFNRYDEIKIAINANHYDSLGSSESGLRAAVAQLEELVESGFTSVEAQILLADSYRQLALTYEANGSDLQGELVAKHADIYKKLIAENPGSVDLLSTYSRLAVNEDDMRIYGEQTQIAATKVLSDANSLLGSLLVRSEMPEERVRGIELLQEAFLRATEVEKVAIGQNLINALEIENELERVEEVRAELARYREETGR